MRLVDLVIPVYDGYDETVACVESVLASIDQAWARIIIINDNSPNPLIREYLHAKAAQSPHIKLLENAENLGFVATVNIGMGYDRTRDVVLLNSDVEVAGDWLQRLRDAAYRHENVASVTPFSNNATVCSFPDICENNALVFGLPLAEIDAQFAAEFSADDVFPIPTGVGCCMYIRRECLDLVGYFDLEAFGRGYGEENDWCQRAAQAGWLNLHLANCFVLHRGGVSFGAEYSPRLTRALDILDKKYPRYHGDIQRYIARDPARATRVRAWLRLFASQNKPKVLMISHKLGGGAQQHVDELASLYSDQGLFLLMIPDRDGQTVRLSCYDGNRRLRDGLFFEIGSDYDRLVELLRGLGIGRVHFHHTMGLPTRLWRIGEDLGCEYDLTIHDYYLVNGNPTLTDRHASFVAEEAPAFDERCAGHRPLPPGIDADTWRHNQRPLVEGAARVIFPSADVCERFSKFFSVENPIVAWHPDFACPGPYPEPEWRYEADRPLRVLVVGAMSREKGAEVLDGVAAALGSERIEFHLLGYAYRKLGANVIAHGPYDNARVHSLVAGINADVVWYPARWPETYSFTLSIALYHGLPVVVPNIGAFVERVGGRPHSTVVDWDMSVAQWRKFWLDVLANGALPESTHRGTEQQACIEKDFYAMNYMRPVEKKAFQLESALLYSLDRNLFANCQKLSRSERILKHIWHFSLKPYGSRMLAVVPFRVQRTIKRSLSHRPLHDIVGK